MHSVPPPTHCVHMRNVWSRRRLGQMVLMGDPKHVARVAVSGRGGRARVGQARGRAKTPDQQHTEVFGLGDEPKPVFVDSTGRRRRRLRHVTYGIGGLLLLALVTLWLSQIGGAVRP